jgi:hypothetical protein
MISATAACPHPRGLNKPTAPLPGGRGHLSVSNNYSITPQGKPPTLTR